MSLSCLKTGAESLQSVWYKKSNPLTNLALKKAKVCVIRSELLEHIHSRSNPVFVLTSCLYKIKCYIFPPTHTILWGLLNDPAVGTSDYRVIGK